jgi:hypothetical protein
MNDMFSDDELGRALREGLRKEAATTEIPDRYDDIVYETSRRRPSRTWVSALAVAAALAVGFGGGLLAQPLLRGSTGSPAGSPTTSVPTVSQPVPTPAGTAIVTIASSTVEAGFDQFPAGYDHANLSLLENVNGRWTVLLDPLTICTSSKDKPECSGLVDPVPYDSTAVNVSTKVYRVPLANGVSVQVLDGGNPPTVKPYITLPFVMRSWGSPIEVVVSLNANNEVTSIRQFWRP